MRKNWLVALSLTIFTLAFFGNSFASDKIAPDKKQAFLQLFDSVWNTAVEKGIFSEKKQKPPIYFLSASEYEFSWCNLAAAFTEYDGSINICSLFFEENNDG